MERERRENTRGRGQIKAVFWLFSPLDLEQREVVLCERLHPVIALVGVVQGAPPPPRAVDMPASLPAQPGHAGEEGKSSCISLHWLQCLFLSSSPVSNSLSSSVLSSSWSPLSLNFLILKSVCSFCSLSSYQENFLSSKDKCTAHLQNFICRLTVGSPAEVDRLL